MAAGDKMMRLFGLYQFNQEVVVVFKAYSAVGPMILYPISEPLPKSSLTEATIMRMIEYPNPLPIPSKNDLHGLFDIAKASNLPIKIQFVMIKPMNTDKSFQIG